MKKLSLGIIGLGGIAERLLPTFLKHARTGQIVGFDIDEERIQVMKKKFGIETVSDMDILINNKKIDAIYLAVPPKYHCNIAVKVMKAGKHILCEKPLAASIDEATKMYEVAKETKVIHAMNFPLYYGFAYSRIRELLSTNTLGAIKRIELSALYPVWPRPWQQTPWIDSREDGGFVREVFTHFIQLINASFGKIENISSFVEYPDNEHKCETGLIGIGELVSGVKVVFNGLCDVNQLGNIRLLIYGSEGSVELQNWRKLIVKTGEQEWITAGEMKDQSKSINTSYEVVNAFYEAIDGEKTRLVGFEEGLQVTKVVEKLLRKS